MAEREQRPLDWRPDPSAGYIKSADLAAEMERIWQECKRHSPPVSAYAVPAWWFERAPVRRVGRRLYRGRWRPTQAFLERTAWWRGNTPVVMDKPLRTDP